MKVDIKKIVEQVTALVVKETNEKLPQVQLEKKLAKAEEARTKEIVKRKRAELLAKKHHRLKEKYRKQAVALSDAVKTAVPALYEPKQTSALVRCIAAEQHMPYQKAWTRLYHILNYQTKEYFGVDLFKFKAEGMPIKRGVEGLGLDTMLHGISLGYKAGASDKDKEIIKLKQEIEELKAA